jgi:Tfp pilus assembly protein PilO
MMITSQTALPLEEVSLLNFDGSWPRLAGIVACILLDRLFLSLLSVFALEPFKFHVTKSFFI